MDPYLEGELWRDVHNSMAVAIRNRLSEIIDPRYVIRLESSVTSNEDPVQEIGLMRPDVAVESASRPPADSSSSVATLVPRLFVPAPAPFLATSLRIRLGKERTLITSIEIVSPANKYGAGLRQFQRKWSTLRRAGVSLVEIDLIRRGERIFTQPELRDAPYLVTVTRSEAIQTGAWPIMLREQLPEIPIPLLYPDEDARVALQDLLNTIYGQARFGNTIDYAGTPPAPPLSAEDAEWARERVSAASAE